MVGPLPPGAAVCLRRRLEVDDPAQVVWLVLRVDWDGGWVAWLNGREIARRHLPGAPHEPVPYEQPPEPGRWAGAAEELDCSAARDALQPGVNVLALQWHPPPGGWSGRLVPELRANFTRGPYVQAVTATSLTWMWRTPRPATSEVELGEDPAALQPVVVSAEPTNRHQVTVGGLRSGTQYWYRVVSRRDGEVARSPVLPCRTFAESGPLRFVVTADLGSGQMPQYAVASVMEQVRPDLVSVAGDLVYPKFTDARADQRFFSVYDRQMRHTPFFVVAGNHDTTHGPPWEFAAAFACPTNFTPPADHARESTWPGAYYSFDCGDAHFVGLYAPIYYRGLELTETSAQGRWLAADLAASRQPWKFIFLHHPLMSSGPHGTDDYNVNGVPDAEELARVLLPLAQAHGVQLIFSGHDHAYERFRPVQGVHCVVTGGGGGNLYSQTRRAPASAQFHYRWHCVMVDVAGEELHLRALDTRGRVFDEFFIRRAAPPPRVYEAAWHSPPVDPAPLPPDGDGNFTDQRVDFAGEALPTVSGLFSNPGRCWVNRDAAHLYLGFAGVMLPDEGNLFVFLESPGLPGVADLRGLGNGVVDPEGEGVDGLDFLENLSFEGFRPAVAAVLGDEFADAPARGFWRTNRWRDAWGQIQSRTNLLFPPGQGVFRLRPGFPDLPGVRLQQFNRSPQEDPVPEEQNADYIIVALPLNELGLFGGETLRLGAVVGGGGFVPDPETQARELDRAYLGTALRGSGTGPVWLAALTVRLPSGPDADEDGLPDAWEVRHGLDPQRADGPDGPEGDPDGDGASTIAEWRAGTHPRDAASVFRLLGLTPAAEAFRVKWSAAPGRWYGLEMAAAPDGPYTEVEGGDWPAYATDTVARARVPAGAETPRYIRLKVRP